MENDLYIKRKRSIYRSKTVYIQIVILSSEKHVLTWKSSFLELSDFKIRFFLPPYLESFQTRLRCWKLFGHEKITRIACSAFLRSDPKDSFFIYTSCLSFQAKSWKSGTKRSFSLWKNGINTLFTPWKNGKLQLCLSCVNGSDYVEKEDRQVPQGLLRKFS